MDERRGVRDDDGIVLAVPPTGRPIDTARELRQRFGDRPFTLEQAFAGGFSRGRVSSAVRAGRLVRLARGVLLVRDPAVADSRDDHRARAAAVLALLDAPAVISHASACVLLGLPIPGIRPAVRWPVEVSGRRGTPRGEGWRRYRIEVPASEVIDVDGLPVTSLPRTAVDVARTRDLPAALIVVDAVARRLVLTAGAAVGFVGDERLLMHDAGARAAADRVLRRPLADLDRVPGVVGARYAVSEAEPAAENAFESYSRGVLLRAGLPRPETGFPVVGDDGNAYWADLAWPDVGVLGEADGRGKYRVEGALYAEKRRQDALERAGWRVVRWTWDEIASEPQLVVGRVAAALRRAGATWT